jgi:hypothetical protein
MFNRAILKFQTLFCRQTAKIIQRAKHDFHDNEVGIDDKMGRCHGA